MSVANKMRAVLNLSNRKIPDLSSCLGMSDQGVRNKFSRDSFSVSDLIKICDALNCELSVKTQNGQVVYLGMDDLKDAETKNAEQKEKMTKMDALILDAVLNPAVPPEGTKVITGEDIIKRYNNGMQED